MLAYARIELEDTVITIAIQASLNPQAGECADNVWNVAIASFLILTAVPYPCTYVQGMLSIPAIANRSQTNIADKL